MKCHVQSASCISVDCFVIWLWNKDAKNRRLSQPALLLTSTAASTLFINSGFSLTAEQLHRSVLCMFQVTTSSILSTQPVEQSLNAAAAAERQTPGSCKAVLQAYAALAVIRQAAQALTQYGIRYAHLYLRHNLDALPVLKK